MRLQTTSKSEPGGLATSGEGTLGLAATGDPRSQQHTFLGGRSPFSG